jgi:uncharacterized Zn finger protein (UPF0148 family)
MLCRSCGNIVPDGLSVCPNCGATLSSEEEEKGAFSESRPISSSPFSFDDDNRKERKKNTLGNQLKRAAGRTRQEMQKEVEEARRGSRELRDELDPRNEADTAHGGLGPEGQDEPQVFSDSQNPYSQSQRSSQPQNPYRQQQQSGRQDQGGPAQGQHRPAQDQQYGQGRPTQGQTVGQGRPPQGQGQAPNYRQPGASGQPTGGDSKKNGCGGCAVTLIALFFILFILSLFGL